MAILITFILCVVLPYLLWNCQSLFTNYRKAQQSGYPILLCPAHTNNILWMIFSVPLRPLLARYLPQFLYDRIKAGIYGWEFLSKYEIFARMGSNFMLVTLGNNELMVADPDTAHDILMRKNDFIQNDVGNRIMGMFGPNLITSVGEDWKRQRRIVAPLLNERISESVWRESSAQAQDMLKEFTRPAKVTEKKQHGNSEGETNATIQGVRSIAINVIGAVAYGNWKPWGYDSESAPSGYRLSYMDAIYNVVVNLVPAALVSVKILTSPIMPKSVQNIGYAVSEFPGHVKDLLAKERSSKGAGNNNLMSTLIKVSDAESKVDSVDTRQKLFMTEDELAGTMFQFTIAGFDTTANTMAYGIALLASYPEWQGWIQEELDEVVRNPEIPEYEKTYPALKRCLALMFEVLRLYTPVAHIARATKSPQQVTTASGTHLVPAGTTIYICGQCVHVNPAIWGPDALSFRPSRWLSETGSIIQPARSTFLPFSGGPRVCPGQKMAEVEFIAVMMTIFTSYKVKPVVKQGETMEIARQNLVELMADSQPRTTVQMNRPDDLKLRWEKR